MDMGLAIKPSVSQEADMGTAWTRTLSIRMGRLWRDRRGAGVLRLASASLGGDARELAAEQRIGGVIVRQFRQQTFGFPGLLFAQEDDAQQDLGKGFKVVALGGHDLEVADGLVLAALDVVEAHEPLDEERQTADQIFVDAGSDVGVVPGRIALEELLRVGIGALG